MTRQELLDQISSLLTKYELDGNEVFVEFMDSSKPDSVFVYNGSSFREDDLNCLDDEDDLDDDLEDDLEDDDCCGNCCGNCCGSKDDLN